MEQPWRTGTDGHVDEVDVAMPAFALGDWSAVEEWLGVVLPSDYKAVVGDGPGLIFSEELWIASPFRDGELGKRIAYGSWSLAVFREELGGDWDVPLFPEPGGLLCWGGDGGGGVYYWDTQPSDPDRWTVVVGGRPVDDIPGQRRPCGLTAYLAGLVDGSIEAATLGDWPGPDPQFRPVT